MIKQVSERLHKYNTHNYIFIIGEVVYDSDNYFGYWSDMRSYYYSCSGDEHSLESCYNSYTSSYHCYTSSDVAGVRCVQG